MLSTLPPVALQICTRNESSLSPTSNHVFVSTFQLLVSGHSTPVRESIPIAAVESVWTSMWKALSTRPACSPLMQITQVQDCEEVHPVALSLRLH